MAISKANEKLPANSSNQIVADQHKQFCAYAADGSEVANRFEVESATGLSGEQAKHRLRVDGANKIQQKKQRSAWLLLLEQFSSIVVWLLAAAALVAWLTDNGLETAAILVVLLINAAIGFMIEWQAARALEALKKATKITARVRRDGNEQIIDAENLVTGDLVILSAGDRVPADARILESANLRADESTLTGESVSVNKNSAPVEISAPLAERSSMLYLGTTIVAGNSSAIVTAIGLKTELGLIGQMVSQADDYQTPLQIRLEELGKKLVYVVLGIALIVLLAGVLRGDDVWLMLEVSISLAVAAVPEGLPAVTTFILALGVLRMARSNAIVRRLAAVEGLGSVTVICTDKTGTLTENRMTVLEYRLANLNVVENFSQDASGVSIDDGLARLLRVSFLCNDAALNSMAKTGQKQSIGDPTETALLFAAEKFGFEIENGRSKYKKLREFPFDSVTKRMIVVLQDEHQHQFAAMKGAPGVVLEICSRFLSKDGESVPLTEAKRTQFRQINEEMADRALRVLAVADKNLEAGFENGSEGQIKDEYTFLGFIGMNDPPRVGAAEAVRKAQGAGIRVVMLTGDQINTARAIARELNLSQTNEIFAYHSRDLREANTEKLAEMATHAQVFARVSPEDKLRIVNALQQAGEIVAVTGDGVNDAPALKQSNIAIAMGERGTEVAKEASDIVLTDDNFSTMVTAIEGGRTIYANIVKFVNLLFSDNSSEVFVIFVAIMAGLPLPLLPLQILWINLVTDVFPALALAVEPASPDTMKHRPHPPDESLLSPRFMFLIFWKGALYGVIVLAAYYWALQTYGEGTHARTIALFTLVAVQLGNLFNSRSRSRSAFVRFFSNPYIFVALGICLLLQILAIYFQPLARILDTTVPNQADYLVIGISFILPVIIVEIVKVFTGKKERI